MDWKDAYINAETDRVHQEVLADHYRKALEYFGKRNNWLVEKDTKWMQFRRPDPHSVTPSNAYINPWEFAATVLQIEEDSTP